MLVELDARFHSIVLVCDTILRIICGHCKFIGQMFAIEGTVIEIGSSLLVEKAMSIDNWLCADNNKLNLVPFNCDVQWFADALKNFCLASSLSMSSKQEIKLATAKYFKWIA